MQYPILCFYFYWRENKVEQRYHTRFCRHRVIHSSKIHHLASLLRRFCIIMTETGSFCAVRHVFFTLTKTICKCKNPFYDCTKAFCEQTKAICDCTNRICECTKTVCEQTKAICDCIKIVCDYTKTVKMARKGKKAQKTFKETKTTVLYSMYKLSIIQR